MITHFIEAGNGFNWGKFMLGRFDQEEGALRSALPEYEDGWLFAARKFVPGMTLVADLQTGEGAAFLLGQGGLPPAEEASYQLNNKHQIWVCPMYEPFLQWLWAQDTKDITKLPRYVELPDAPSATAGYRRTRGKEQIKT